MYRDDSTQLDEHDRAVGAIQIADSLVSNCLHASKRLASSEHRWRAVREINDDYGEAWRQLDCARQLLAARGANIVGFDELRAHVHPVLQLRADGVDTARIDDARRAIAELRLAMPGADWKAIEARTRSLASTSFGRGVRGLAFAGIAAVLAIVVATWSASLAPAEAVVPRVEAQISMQQERPVVVEDRRDRISQLELLIGGRCDRPRVMEYVQLLVKEGRFDDAHGYGEDYTLRCGDDPTVQKWSKLAKKKLDRLSKL